MNVGELKEYLKDVPDNTNLVYSDFIILDPEDEMVAIVDHPIVGIALNETESEIRFCLRCDDEDQARQFFGKFIVDGDPDEINP